VRIDDQPLCDRSACDLFSARPGTASLFADGVLSRTLRHLPRSAGNEMSWFDSSLSPNRRATEAEPGCSPTFEKFITLLKPFFHSEGDAGLGKLYEGA
jgi:hypothetical protein